MAYQTQSFYIWHSKWHMWLTYICLVAKPQLKDISNTTHGYRAYQIRVCRGCKEHLSEKEYSKKWNSNCAITFKVTCIFLHNQKQIACYCVFFNKNTTAEMKIMFSFFFLMFMKLIHFQKKTFYKVIFRKKKYYSKIVRFRVVCTASMCQLQNVSIWESCGWW